MAPNNGDQVDVIYLDMSKAFDKVSHCKLLKKLSDYGFGRLDFRRSFVSGLPSPRRTSGEESGLISRTTAGNPAYGFGGKLLAWLKSYLYDRMQRVTAFGVNLQALLVTPGVPEGSILSPMLFLLYANSLPGTVKFSHAAAFYGLHSFPRANHACAPRWLKMQENIPRV